MVFLDSPVKMVMVAIATAIAMVGVAEPPPLGRGQVEWIGYTGNYRDGWQGLYNGIGKEKQPLVGQLLFVVSHVYSNFFS